MEKWWSDGAKAFFLEYPTHPYTPAFGLSDTYLSQDDFRKKFAVERSFHNGYAVTKANYYEPVIRHEESKNPVDP